MFERIFRLMAIGPVFLFATSVHADLPSDGSIIRFHMAEYSFEITPADTDNKSQTIKVEWAYPVFIDGPSPGVQRLNGWLRRLSLEHLLSGDAKLLSEVLGLPDREVIKRLAINSDFASTEVIQAIVNADRALGEYRFFTLVQTDLGQARPQHGISTYIYNLRLGHPVEMKSLFKPEASELLSELLQSQIERKTPECRKRSFEWQYTSIGGPTDVFIEFPYAPAEWRDCGDGVYLLKGRKIRALLNSPQKMYPNHKLILLQ